MDSLTTWPQIIVPVTSRWPVLPELVTLQEKLEIQVLGLNLSLSLLVGNSFIGGLLSWLSAKEYTCQAGDAGLIPGQEDPQEKEMATHSSVPA